MCILRAVRPQSSIMSFINDYQPPIGGASSHPASSQGRTDNLPANTGATAFRRWRPGIPIELGKSHSPG